MLDQLFVSYRPVVSIILEYCNAAAKVPKHCDIMVSPTYLVGLDTLKVDRPVYESVLAWRNGQGWQKCFSRSLTLSNLFQKDLPLHGPLSCCSDGRIEVHGSWSRQSSYLSRSDRLVCVLIPFLCSYYIQIILYDVVISFIDCMFYCLELSIA